MALATRRDTAHVVALVGGGVVQRPNLGHSTTVGPTRFIECHTSTDDVGGVTIHFN